MRSDRGRIGEGNAELSFRDERGGGLLIAAKGARIPEPGAGWALELELILANEAKGDGRWLGFAGPDGASATVKVRPLLRCLEDISKRKEKK